MLVPYWWMETPVKRIIFIFVILIALTVARWLWKMGDVWTWGEEKHDSTAKRGLLDSSKEDE